MIIGFIVGALVAYLTTKNLFITLVIGIAGYFLARKIFPGLQVRALSNDEKLKIERAFFNAVFPLLGVIAKADGRVDKREIESAERLFAQMGLNDEARNDAIVLFQDGVKGDCSVESLIQVFTQACTPHKQFYQLLLVYLISMAYADGELDNDEEAVIRQISVYLGYTSFGFNHLLGMVKAQIFFEKKQHSEHTNSARSNEIEEAYKALGVTSDVTDQQLKFAYRKLMGEYHPDRLSGQGLPEHVIKVATAKAQDIQAAYAVLKNMREVK